jgi:RNA polymerase sigma-70 factor, ECF subfamily
VRQLARAADVVGQVGGDDPEVLLGRVARGDEAAFEALCNAVAGMVLGIARAVLRDSFQAEELCQEVLLELWRSACGFKQGQGNAMAWVATIAHRRAIDRVRSERRAADREQRAASHGIDYDQVAESVEIRLDRERVRRCLGSLTELQRESVILAYYGGHTFREVAELLGVPEGTVKTRMRDGLIRLRDCMGAE